MHAKTQILVRQFCWWFTFCVFCVTLHHTTSTKLRVTEHNSVIVPYYFFIHFWNHFPLNDGEMPGAPTVSPTIRFWWGIKWWNVLCFVYLDDWIIIVQINSTLCQYDQSHLSDCSIGLMFQWTLDFCINRSENIHVTTHLAVILPDKLNKTVAHKHILLTNTGFLIVYSQVATVSFMFYCV